ncbi:MAG TPA: PHB depolymerase family esterase [Solirubrobacteraceae bacterium]|nr:PHB depolymerase family esterase [Solirubrobacteraceae bacterium]
MRGRLLLVAWLVAVSMALASGAVAQGAVEYGQAKVAGLERTWRLLVPDTVTRRAPVLVVLHAGGATADEMAAATRMDAAAAAQGFVVIYPQAHGTRFNAGICCSSVRGDVAFVDRLLDDLQRRFQTDRRRVFAAGFSNGGFMAYRLACQRSQRFAAIAAVAATELTVPCRPSHPVSVVHIHARDETKVPFFGGRWARHPRAGRGYRGSPSAFALARRWRTRNRCRSRRTTVARSATLTTWHTRGCARHTQVALVAPTLGGHRWFGGLPPYGASDDAIDATAQIAAFFTGLPVTARKRIRP